MNWPCRLLLVACSCGITVAQEVPNINDVYAVDRATKLGPSKDPTDILDRYADRMRGCNRLDYTASVTYTLAPEGEIVEVQGAVAVGRGPGGRFDRFWFDATGTMPDVGEINVAYFRSFH